MEDGIEALQASCCPGHGESDLDGDTLFTRGEHAWRFEDGRVGALPKLDAQG